MALQSGACCNTCCRERGPRGHTWGFLRPNPGAIGPFVLAPTEPLRFPASIHGTLTPGNDEPGRRTGKCGDFKHRRLRNPAGLCYGPRTHGTPAAKDISRTSPDVTLMK
ncbi:hypothetical protein DPEC_G00112310 [Dallia pectoralis]|uniref:Uncharacterized protein n=1 Tax=Dallia pectoralis TaxID=75939 RepID=A0ACC2GT58_DALPE|nr:hypothetical protein DPEC_G00112310 [Dallia pectoralis]